MQIETIVTEKYVQYTVNGKLDSVAAPAFEETVIQGFQAQPADAIFHLKDLAYISSSGLRVFLQAAKIARLNNTRIVLSAVRPEVKEIFDLAGFTAFFTFADSPEDAVRSLSGD